MKTAMRTQRSKAVRKVPANDVLRIGSVSYLNAKPLIYGLGEAPDLELHLEVPSALLARIDLMSRFCR
jgi:hypothetical protein